MLVTTPTEHLYIMDSIKNDETGKAMKLLERLSEPEDIEYSFNDIIDYMKPLGIELRAPLVARERSYKQKAKPESSIKLES